MKTQVQRIAASSLIAFALSGLVPAQPAAGSGSLQSVEPLNAITENFTLEKLAGKPLRGPNQEEFSTIEDYLIEPQTGRVHFAVVPAGGNTFRIVPMQAMTPLAGDHAFTVQRTRAEWDQVGTMTADRLQGSIVIYEDHQQRLARQFALPNAETAAQGLLRASSLRGREVRGGNELLGTIENVVIDYNNQVAAPVVALRGEGAGQKFTLPMSRLQIPAGQGPIDSTLTRNELQPAQVSNLAPTGNVPLATAVTAVQQALERNASLPAGSVQVIPESRLILRGVVDNQRKKTEAERAAQQAAPGVRIENQLSIRNW